VNKFLSNIHTLPLKKRIAIAWRIIKGK
jgi:hypothetical protein